MSTTQVKLPKLGEQVSSGVVLEVLVSPGDHVDADQPILELETDKATTEVPCPKAGTVKELLVDEGDEIESGQPILTLEEDDDGESGGEQEASAGADGEEEAGEAAEEEREAGSAEDREEDKDEDEADEEKPETGSAEERDEDEDEVADEKPEDGSAEDRGEEREEARAEEPSRERKRVDRTARSELDPADEGAARIGEPVPASPSMRRLARELGVVLDEVPGTGPGGRVTEDDVKSHVRHLLQEASAQDRRGEDRGPELPDFSTWGEVEREALGAVRKRTAETVTLSWGRIPHVSQFDRADIGDLQEFRERFAPKVEEAGGKLTLTAVLVKVLAEALRHFPRFNASLDEEAEELILKRYVHVGVAVDTDQGLLVPVLRDVDRKGLVRVAVELGRAAEDARNGALSADDMQGASFSITNLGGYGTTDFTPIIVWPQVAILGVGRATVQAVWDGRRFAPREILPLGITYDHRVVDGADAAKFVRWIAEVLEEPMRLTMEP